MKQEERFEKIWIDLREFGWGIRQVPVIWPEDHEGGGQPGPDSVGTDEIVDGSIQSQDMSDDVRNRLTPKYDEQGEGIKLGGL